MFLQKSYWFCISNFEIIFWKLWTKIMITDTFWKPVCCRNDNTKTVINYFSASKIFFYYWIYYQQIFINRTLQDEYCLLILFDAMLIVINCVSLSGRQYIRNLQFIFHVIVFYLIDYLFVIYTLEYNIHRKSNTNMSLELYFSNEVFHVSKRLIIQLF